LSYTGANRTLSVPAIKRLTYKKAHTEQTFFQLMRVSQLMSSFVNHRVTGMSCVRGSSQLTLHLQSPAAAAAALQRVEEAAAAAEANPSIWHEYQVGCPGITQDCRPCLDFARRSANSSLKPKGFDGVVAGA
jgi:hypothetical protein